MGGGGRFRVFLGVLDVAVIFGVGVFVSPLFRLWWVVFILFGFGASPGFIRVCIFHNQKMHVYLIKLLFFKKIT